MAKSHRTLTLVDGRIVSLTWLEQWAVYAGLLEGLPTRQQNDATIAAVLAKARAQDGHEPLLIAPLQKQIEHDGRYPFGEPASLPPVGCLARFCSPQPARDPRNDYSELTVIWFQDDYAFPLSDDAERHILAMDWSALARDREY